MVDRKRLTGDLQGIYKTGIKAFGLDLELHSSAPVAKPKSLLFAELNRTMQRLGENAMWLREDNRSSMNEIVIPYDIELALWDRPHWIDSILRLRWCCPAPQQPKEEKLGRPKAKKSKKKTRKQAVQTQDTERWRSRASGAYHRPRYGAPPPPPPSPLDEYRHHQLDHHHTYDHYGRFGYPHYSSQTDDFRDRHQYQQRQEQQQHQQLHRYDYFPPMHDHRDHLLNSHPNEYLQFPQCHQNEQFLSSSLSSLGSDCFPAVVTPGTDSRLSDESQEDPTEYLNQDDKSQNETPAYVNQDKTPIPKAQDDKSPAANISAPQVNMSTPVSQEDLPSPVAAAAAATAAATLKREAERHQLQQHRHSTTSKKSSLPPLVHRGVSPLQSNGPQQEKTVTISPGGVKPPLPQGPRSVNRSDARPLSQGCQILPSSPNAVRPRRSSEDSRRSGGTSSTRHRRQAYETFEFSFSSLQQIVNKDEEDLPRTSPPAYIECPRLPASSEWPNLDKPNEDDGNNGQWTTSSNPVDCISPGDSDETSALQVRNPNVPAIQWMNSWAAQGDAAAGNPSNEAKLPEGYAISDSVRISDNYLSTLVGKQTRWPPKEIHSLNVENPVFLPRCKEFDRPIRKAKNRVVISGWAAISLSDKLRNRLAVMEGPLQLKRSDIAYFQIIQPIDRSKPPVFRIKQESNDHVIELRDRYNHQFQSQEVCGRAGRCVCLVDVSSREVMATILPVSLPKYFFSGNEIVDEELFAAWQPALFTPFTTQCPRANREGSGREPEYYMNWYAPDEQNDAATYVLFASDSVLSAD